jgi:hypothetical protein
MRPWPLGLKGRSAEGAAMSRSKADKGDGVWL